MPDLIKLLAKLNDELNSCGSAYMDHIIRIKISKINEEINMNKTLELIMLSL